MIYKTVVEKKKPARTKKLVSKEETPKKVSAPSDISAVIAVSGSQYLVRVGDELELNRLDVEPGKDYLVEDVLLLKRGEDVEIGTPTVKGAKVILEVLEHKKGKKITILKYKAKSRYRKKRGFRAALTLVKVKEMSF